MTILSRASLMVRTALTGPGLVTELCIPRGGCADVTAGYNGTVFAYGQTGSGKTFTMMVREEHVVDRETTSSFFLYGAIR